MSDEAPKKEEWVEHQRYIHRDPPAFEYIPDWQRKTPGPASDPSLGAECGNGKFVTGGPSWIRITEIPICQDALGFVGITKEQYIRLAEIYDAWAKESGYSMSRIKYPESNQPDVFIDDVSVERIYIDHWFHQKTGDRLWSVRWLGWRNRGFWFERWLPGWHKGRGHYVSIGLGLFAIYRGY
jgi:hypothetical protein